MAIARAPNIDVAPKGVNFNALSARQVWVALVAAPLLAACGGSGGQPAPIDPGALWPTHLGNGARAPFLSERVTTDTPIVVWSAAIDGGIRGVSAVTRQVVIVGSTKRQIVALNRQDGSEYWRKGLEGPPSPPLLIGDVIVTATEGRGKLRVLDLTEGDDLWKHDFISVSTTMSLSNDTLYVATEDGFLYALDTTEQGQIWRTRLPRAAKTGPLIVGNWVTHITGDSLYLLSRTDGHRQSAVEIGDFVAGEPATDGQSIYVTTETGTLMAWSTPELELLWRSAGFDDFLSGPIIADDAGYAVSRSGELVRFDIEDGATNLLTHVGGTVSASPAVVSNGILIGTLNGKLSFLTRNGEPIWTVELGGSVVQPAIVHEGRILVPMFDSQRGKFVELR